jgi:predicted acylesterase/phospholipase RssA
MKIHREDIKTGLVLPGGGARGAYQVGVLNAWLRESFSRDQRHIRRRYQFDCACQQGAPL